MFHQDAIPVKYSLLTPGPAFYPVPSVLLLSWNSSNLQKYVAHGIPSLPWWLLLCRAKSRASSVSHSQFLCWGAAPLSEALLGWQCCLSSSVSGGNELQHQAQNQEWRHCQPPLWLLYCREEAGGVYGSDVLFICLLKSRLLEGWAVFLWRVQSAWYNQKRPAEKKKKQQTAKAWLGWSRKKGDPCYLWWSTGCPQRWTDQHPWSPPLHLWKANFVKIIPEISREINFKISLLSQNR